MSTTGKNIGSQDMQYVYQVTKYKNVMKKTAELKRINKFRYSGNLENKLINVTKQAAKLLGAILLTVFMFVVIYYSTIEFINMKYGGEYGEIYAKPESGAQKYRSIPNIREQVKIKAEREMIFNKIHNAIDRLD